MAKKKPSAPGPKPDVLVIEDELYNAVRRALKKKKPKEGWPKSTDKEQQK